VLEAAKQVCATALDPVCLVEIEELRSLRCAHDGRTYAFCSAECLAEFERAPGDFAADA
jgi:YHS domain-containing protein